MVDKVVDGDYFVSTIFMKEDGFEINVINVSQYSETDKCYYRWSYNDNVDKVMKLRGVLLEGTNCMSWALLNPKDHGYDSMVVIEKYDPKKLIWTSREYRDGKLVTAMSGVGVKKD